MMLLSPIVRMVCSHHFQPVLAGMLLLSSGWVQAQGPLARSTPEAQGVASAGVLAFVEAADRDVKSMHSFMLLRHGHVVAEAWWKPEGPEKPHQLWSLSKSFTSTAVGLAIQEGKLRLDDKVLSFFPDQAPAKVSENLRAMTVKDLLTMTCGHDKEVKLTLTDTLPWVQAFLGQPVPHAPGTHFLYNTPGTHMLSAIVRKVTGETVLEYLQPRLFGPLGITKPEWPASPQGNTIGGWGLFLKTEDISKFGQLYLQKGQWQGKQLVPESWVALASARQVLNDAGRKEPDLYDWAHEVR
jgi:CubicO group peptidase (beta-lactamase class C family)